MMGSSARAMRSACSSIRFAPTTSCAVLGWRVSSTPMASSSGSCKHWGESEHKHGSIGISTTWVRVPRSTFRLPIFERRELQGEEGARDRPFVPSPPVNVGLNSSGEPDAAQKILKPSIGPERIEGGPQEDGGVESRLIGLVQPDHRLIVVAESHIDQGNIRVRSGAVALRRLQVLGYFHRLVLPS